MTPHRCLWEPRFCIGHEIVDAQHRALFAQCDRLADLCEGEELDQAGFRAAYENLMHLAQEHFATEEALLAAGAYPELEQYRAECEEYRYLAEQIATPENFDPIELQRFLALWWVGHVLTAIKEQQANFVP